MVILSIPGSNVNNQSFELPTSDNIAYHHNNTCNITVKDRFSEGVFRSYGGLLILRVQNSTRVEARSYHIVNTITVEKLNVEYKKISIINSRNYTNTSEITINLKPGFYRVLYEVNIFINGTPSHGIVKGNNILFVNPPEDKLQ